MSKIVVYLEWKISGYFARMQQATKKVMIHVKIIDLSFLFSDLADESY